MTGRALAPGGAGAFLGLGGDLVVAFEDPPDRGHAGAGLWGQVVPDGTAEGLVDSGVYAARAKTSVRGKPLTDRELRL